jgi:hypothetical protein
VWRWPTTPAPPVGRGTGACRCVERLGSVAAKPVGAFQLHRLLTRLKRTPGYAGLYEVSKCAPEEALRDLDRAYANLWRSRKLGRRVSRPRFKKRGRCPERFRLTGAIHWYVALTVEVVRPDPARVIAPVVAIDRGISTFAVCSDGTRLESPRALGHGLRRLRRRSRQVTRKQPGSANRRKAALALARPTPPYPKPAHRRAAQGHHVAGESQVGDRWKICTLLDCSVTGAGHGRSLIRAGRSSNGSGTALDSLSLRATSRPARPARGAAWSRRRSR